MNADSASMTGDDPPALRQAEPQSSPRISSGKERVESVFSLGGRQLGAVVEQVKLQPVPALPSAVPHSQANLAAMPDSADRVPQEFDQDDLELLGIEGGRPLRVES